MTPTIQIGEGDATCKDSIHERLGKDEEGVGTRRRMTHLRAVLAEMSDPTKDKGRGRNKIVRKHYRVEDSIECIVFACSPG